MCLKFVTWPHREQVMKAEIEAESQKWSCWCWLLKAESQKRFALVSMKWERWYLGLWGMSGNEKCWIKDTDSFRKKNRRRRKLFSTICPDCECGCYEAVRTCQEAQRMLAQNQGVWQWQPVIVLLELIGSHCHCVRRSNRPFTDVELITEEWTDVIHEYEVKGLENRQTR